MQCINAMLKELNAISKELFYFASGHVTKIASKEICKMCVSSYLAFDGNLLCQITSLKIARTR